MAQETKIAIKLEEEAKPIKKMCEKLMDTINHELDKGIENIDTKELGEAIDMVKDLYEAKKEMYEACYYKQIMEAMEESEYGEDYTEDGPTEQKKGYRGQPRSESGRFMSRSDGRRSNRGRGGRRGYDEMDYMMPIEWDDMEQMRDMDRMAYGRMGYSGSGSMGSSGGQSSGGSSMSGGGSRGYSDGGRQSEGGNYSSREQRDSREGRSGQSRRGYMEAKEQGKEKQEKMKELENYMKELSEDVSEMIQGSSPEEKTMLKNKMQMLMQKIQ